MNFEVLANSPLVNALGWTLVHSLWQIIFVAFLLFAVLKIAAKQTANFRYLLACAALVAALALPLGTFIWIYDGAVRSDATILISDSKQKRALREENAFTEKTSADVNNQTPVAQQQAENLSLQNLQNDFENRFAQSLPLFVALWICGVMIFALRTGGGLLRLRVLKTQASTHASEEWQTRLAELCERAGIAQLVRLCESALVDAPVVVGWLKPVILVPSGALLGLSAAQMEAIIVHELMHVRRHDFLVNLLQSFAEIALFYHPCAWWISAVIRREREFVCDDAVVAFYGERLVYARALANLETFRQTAKQNQPQLTLAATGGKLMNRIARILQKETEIKRAPSLWSAVAACVLISAFLLTVFWGGNRQSVNAESGKRNKKIAVGFVSIPPADRSDNAPHDAQATAQILIEKLKAHRVPAIGFLIGTAVVNVEKASVNPPINIVRLNPVRAEIVRTWRDAGFEVGIGGFRHIWFYHTPYEVYVSNVEQNERIAKQILAEKNLPLRYFSYPFLNTGKSTEEKARFENWLQARGLRSVKYTFDNQEWMYSFAYDMARKDNDVNTMKQIRAEFLDYMTKMLQHYEAYSEEMFGRDIAQTMVLTPSRLVADTADEFFGLLVKRDYTFVSMDEAQADEAYRTEENFIGESGISWFERWAMARKQALRDEPRISSLVQKTWDEKKPKK
jgi:beta-lactamase regulating signal transducer with metallopeptidase domain